MYDDEAERVYEAACHLVRQGISVIPTGGGVSQGAKEPHKQALIASGHTYTNGDGELRASWKPMQTQLPTAQDLKTLYVRDGTQDGRPMKTSATRPRNSTARRPVSPQPRARTVA